MWRTRRFLLAVGLALICSSGAITHPTLASSARADANTLTIMTCCGMWAGFTKATIAGSGIPYINYYKEVWHKRFPTLQIKEIDVQTVPEMNTKLLLAVNAGDPPDLVDTNADLGLLVARKAVQNLDAYYARAGMKASAFLPVMADYARVQGHWYGIPAASGQATKKVTRWDSKGNLVRIGTWVDGINGMPFHANLYCGRFATYDPATSTYHVNSPCIKDYFRYEKRLLDFYGGVQKYTKFVSGDPGVWGGYTPKAYIPSGRVVFPIDAYWTAFQMDNYWNVDWRLAPPPTPHGTLAERAGNDSITQWMVSIPTGAKHPQLAFDFATYTFWNYGYLQGPTTNGYVLKNQGQQWAQEMIQADAQVRAKRHLSGNPMATAVQLVMQDAALARSYGPNDVASDTYNQQLANAWQQIEYGRASVDQALDSAQRAIDAAQKRFYIQFGMR